MSSSIEYPSALNVSFPSVAHIEPNDQVDLLFGWLWAPPSFDSQTMIIVPALAIDPQTHRPFEHSILRSNVTENGSHYSRASYHSWQHHVHFGAYSLHRNQAEDMLFLLTVSLVFRPRFPHAVVATNEGGLVGRFAAPVAPHPPTH